jgi:3-hydroxybutyryl-CoA dehydrogenase
MEIQKIMVVGAGQMGNGIAQVMAQAEIDVILHDVSEAALEKGLAAIERNLSKLVSKGKMTREHKEEALSRIQTTADLYYCEAADLIIEAIVEKIEVKRELFSYLDRNSSRDTIFATNTSSLPITEIASATKRQDKVIGMHFMNPVPVMKLVEIICGVATSRETFRIIESLTKRIGKTPVEVNDFPGFVSNRVLMPMINEAIFCVYEGVAKPEAVDDIMKLGMHHPMGPLELADFIGLDTCLFIMEVLYEGFKDSKYRPCPLLRQYVKAGWLGKKSGRGFYHY